MAQRDLLENSVNLLNTQRGPGKLLYAAGTLAMPIRMEQVIDPTGGGAASGWTSLGATRGGINAVKRIDQNVLADIDQFVGNIGVQNTGRAYNITTQLAEWLDRNQFALVWETGTPTFVSTTGATQVMVPLDSGQNQPIERRLAVAFPKPTIGKALVFVFRRVVLAGGDKAVRLDRTDPVSPALELLALPEISTAIPSEQALGMYFDFV